MGNGDFADGLYLNKDLQKKLRRYRIIVLAYILGGLLAGGLIVWYANSGSIYEYK